MGTFPSGILTCSTCVISIIAAIPYISCGIPFKEKEICSIEKFNSNSIYLLICLPKFMTLMNFIKLSSRDRS